MSSLFFKIAWMFTLNYKGLTDQRQVKITHKICIKKTRKAN